MIYHHTEDFHFNLKDKIRIRSWIKEVITTEKYYLGTINYIYCSDQYIINLNKKALNHDFYTDIITFDYCDADEISGDLFISIDRVKDNSQQLKLNFIDELHRVMIHGVLHLCGYGDKSKEDIKIMRSKEDYYLGRFNSNS